MEFAQIRALAENEFGLPADGSVIEITIGSAPDDPAGNRLFHRLQAEVEKNAISARIVRTGSFGCGDLEPIAVIDAPGRSIVMYLKADSESPLNLEADGTASVATLPGGGEYFLSGETVRDIPHISTLPLFNLQNRIALRNCGWIDPGSIDHYILSGHGFAALSRALSKSRRELMQAFETSALEGYIHTGCSAPDRWKECMETDSPDTYLVCNAVTADPGGRAARLLLESDPFSILEGMLIGAYAIRASRCIVCVRSGAGSVSNLRKAIDKMESYGLLGADILGSSFSTRIEIKEAPKDYRMGNEFLSLHCIDSKQPDPHILPAYPLIDELTRNPAIVVNPAALAYLPALFLEQNELRSGFGATPGTSSKVVSLSENVARKYTVEIPCGVSIRSVAEEIGGGIAGGNTLKAVRAGIPTGFLLVEPDVLDGCCHCKTPATIDDGTIAVLDDDTNIVETAKILMAAVHEQSCGKCLLCFEGSRQMGRILDDIDGGRGKLADLDLLKELCNAMKTGCMCVFGCAATDFVLSSLGLFRSEYEKRMTNL